MALLIGLSANAILGWWWADALAALFISCAAVKEGWETWLGDACCDEEGALLEQAAMSAQEDAIRGERCCEDSCDCET